MIRILRRLGIVLAWVVCGLLLLWATGALWFDLPAPGIVRKIAAAGLLIGGVRLGIFGGRRGRIVAVGILGLIAGWWLTLRPSNDRPWQPNVAKTAWAEVDGDTVIIHNVRNCEYRTTTDYTPIWETRTVRLSQITGMDLAINYWGSPYMAHPIASFQFTDAQPVCFSVETRREVGENYSAIGGFYRQYELIYIVADERDVFRVRTNHNGEDIYLYRMDITPERARKRFLEYISTLNALHEQARWYNAVTANCTTSILSQQRDANLSPWDWRILVNGYGDEMLFERGSFVTGGLPFAQLKSRSLINDLARAANDSLDFSRAIRVRLPASTQ